MCVWMDGRIVPSVVRLTFWYVKCRVKLDGYFALPSWVSRSTEKCQA